MYLGGWGWHCWSVCVCAGNLPTVWCCVVVNWVVKIGIVHFDDLLVRSSPGSCLRIFLNYIVSVSRIALWGRFPIIVIVIVFVFVIGTVFVFVDQVISLHQCSVTKIYSWRKRLATKLMIVGVDVLTREERALRGGMTLAQITLLAWWGVTVNY